MAETAYVPRLRVEYDRSIRGKLTEKFGYANVMQVPALVKISVNMGVGEAARDAKLIEGAVKDLGIITGQKPAIARATKSIAQFKPGDTMWIEESKPISKLKRWTVLRGEQKKTA